MTADRLSCGLNDHLGQLVQHCFLKLCLSEQFVELQGVFLQALQLLSGLSFQAAELVAQPIIVHGLRLGSGQLPEFCQLCARGVPFSSFSRHGYSLPAS